MSHQFEILRCKKCSKPYCCVCEQVCPKCGEYNSKDGVAVIEGSIGLHMDKKERAEQERIVLAYQISYMKYNVNKKKFPLVTSLSPKTAVELTDEIGKKHPKMYIQKILAILEKDLSKK